MAAELSFLHRLLNWNKKSAPETVDTEQYAEAFGQFKKLLLELYQIRIQAKTANRLPINLRAKSTNFGTSPERAALYFDDLTIESEDVATEIDKILNTHQRLLLIGDPGAGKTTILLFAAINILMDENREQKLPLILNLATWQKDREFKEWYAQSIAHTYSLSPVFVEELLRRNAVVPFFDGYDEVAEDSQEDCFQKMAGYFGDQRSRQFIVSSRKKEYAAVNADAPVYVEIEVQPLLLAQIQKALFENGQTHAGDLALLYALDRDEYLGKAVEVPFYLNTVSFLFGKGERTLTDFRFTADSTEGRQEELVAIFMKEQVPEEREKKYLSFLAGKMNEENFLIFELGSLQPRWCGKWWRKPNNYAQLIGLIVGLGWKLFYGILVYLAISILILIGVLLLDSEIRTADIKLWRWKHITSKWKFILSDITGGFLIILFFGPIALASVFEGRFVLAYTLGILLLINCAYSISRHGSSTIFLLHLSNPYQRFQATFSTSFWIIPTFYISAISLGLLFAYLGPLKQTLPILQSYPFWIVTLILAILFTTFPLFSSQLPQHFLLRLILYLENKLPLRLVTFLDRQTDQHIFEDTRRTIKGKKQRGASWRFRHKILQDYFAKMPTNPHNRSKP